MKDHLSVPKNKRHLFAQPLDTLIAGSRNETITNLEKRFRGLEIKKNNFLFFLVGDIVTNDFLNNDFLRKYVKVCIIDEKTQRDKILFQNTDFFDEIIEVENPKGMISTKMWSLFKELNNKKGRILINITRGEEDLLVIPLIDSISLDLNTEKFVFYGQPPLTDAEPPIPEGIVLVHINKKIKNTISKFIKYMKKSEA